MNNETEVQLEVKLCGRCSKPKGTTDECCKCGRPIEFKEEYIQEAEKYLLENQDLPRGDNDDKLNVKLPTLEGFALRIGHKLDTLNVWAEKNEKFLGALNKIREEQRSRLINKGLSGQYNPVISKLILSANHGMKEKTENEQKITGSISLIDLFNKTKE